MPRTLNCPHAGGVIILLLTIASASAAGPQIVAGGKAAGGYAAFPDVCRAKSGELLCVFYSGYGHVSTPNQEWPKGGRVMLARSHDEGRTWSEPVILDDTAHD